MAVAPTAGSQKEKAPGFGEKSGLGGDLLNVGMRFGLPLAYLGATQKNIKKLRKQASPDLQAPDLMTGTVKDMARPNFALPNSSEMGGSSLAEYMNNGVQRDAFQRDAELNYEYQNAASRQQQEAQVVDRTNQNTLNKANTKNQESLFNAQAAVSELLGTAIPDRTSTVSSIFHNLDRDIYNAGVAKDTKETMFASEVLRNPDNYSPEEMSWAKSIFTGGGMPLKRMNGGKLKKTRFSV